jgi:hypothetical protein
VHENKLLRMEDGRNEEKVTAVRRNVHCEVKVVLTLMKCHTMRTSGRGGEGLRCSCVCSRWRWVVSFKSRSPHPHGKSLWYASDRRLREPQSWSGWYGKIEKSFLSWPGTES